MSQTQAMYDQERLADSLTAAVMAALKAQCWHPGESFIDKLEQLILSEIRVPSR